MPGPTSDDRSKWIEAASLANLPPGSAREFAHAGRIYALFRIGDELACIDGLCPHRGGHLAAGPLSGPVVTCPRRGCLRWRFDVFDGSSPLGPLPPRRRYPTRVEGGSVFVALPSP